MELEDQVVSLEIAKKLKELGVEQDSLFYWVDGKIGYGYEGEWFISQCEEESYFIFQDYVHYRFTKTDPELRPLFSSCDKDYGQGADFNEQLYLKNLRKEEKERTKNTTKFGTERIGWRMMERSNPMTNELKPCPNCKEDDEECACIRNKCLWCGNSVGNITFTCCDKCWDNATSDNILIKVKEPNE